MKDTEFKLLDPIADSINDKFEELLERGEFANILKQLQDAVGQLPDSYSASFDFQLNVFDACPFGKPAKSKIFSKKFCRPV